MGAEFYGYVAFSDHGIHWLLRFSFIKPRRFIGQTRSALSRRVQKGEGAKDFLASPKIQTIPSLSIRPIQTDPALRRILSNCRSDPRPSPPPVLMITGSPRVSGAEQLRLMGSSQATLESGIKGQSLKNAHPKNYGLIIFARVSIF